MSWDLHRFEFLYTYNKTNKQNKTGLPPHKSELQGLSTGIMTLFSWLIDFQQKDEKNE